MDNLHFDPAIVKWPAINFWTVGLVIFYLFNLWLFWYWLRPKPDTVRRMLYELLTSEVIGKNKRETDYKKVLGLLGMALVSFLMIKKQLMASQAAAAGNGVDNTAISELLLFVGTMAGYDVWSKKYDNQATVALNAPPQAPPPSFPPGPVPVTVTNSAASPVPVEPTGPPG